MRRLAAISAALASGLPLDFIASSELRHRVNVISFGVRPSLTKCGVAYYFAMKARECSSTLCCSTLGAPDRHPAAMIND
ncbi:MULTISPECIES: hypothetical protein [unclassified Bradyrhizobium]|uniref:hypothetical protein n=1 Tax=unclassified Bradyrhizobium TaxID=2631580 RepID=UPI0028E42203|nr:MULTISPECIES: hypothetical protein [unclassified Bradyrhizobium]